MLALKVKRDVSLRPLRNPRKNRVSPIHRQLSVPMSNSAIRPSDWDMNEIVFVSPCTNENRSTFIGWPLMAFNVAAPTSNPSYNKAYVNRRFPCKIGLRRTFTPSRFKQVPFPDPAGIGAMGILNASAESGCCANPFITSWMRPSPDTDTNASYSKSMLLLISTACFAWVVSEKDLALEKWASTMGSRTIYVQ